MSTDYENLRQFVLATTKAQLASKKALAILRIHIDTLEDRLQAVSPIKDEDSKQVLSRIQRLTDESFSELDGRIDEMLSVLESYANG